MACRRRHCPRSRYRRSPPAGQLASWLPCALLTPAVVGGALRVRVLAASLPRRILLHAGGAVLFALVGGALMGTLESLLPWARSGPSLAVARSGILRYLGADLLLYCLVVAATEAVAHAWESRRAVSPPLPTHASSRRRGSMC